MIRCEIPWSNFALTILALEAQMHPEWTGQMHWSVIAQDAELHAIERGAESVDASDVRNAVGCHIIDTASVIA